MKCDKCNRDFEEKLLHCSHDIPKYFGGSDPDGRHWLCVDCHNDYEMIILLKCLDFVGETYIEGERSLWMKELSRQSNDLKKEFRKIAKEIKEDYYG